MAKVIAVALLESSVQCWKATKGMPVVGCSARLHQYAGPSVNPLEPTTDQAVAFLAKVITVAVNQSH